MLDSKSVHGKTADAATSAVCEETGTLLDGTDSVLSHFYCNEHDATRQPLIESLANCRYLQGQVNAQDRARIMALLPHLDPAAPAADLHFAVQGFLLEHPELENAVHAMIRQMQYNVHRQSWEFRELFDAALPPIRWIVPCMIPEGLTLVGGRPKTGKSLLMMSLAKAVGGGGEFLGNAVEPGSVLMLALEDGARRFRSRSITQGWERDVDVQIYFDWDDLGFDGFERLVTFMEQQNIDLVVVDTLSRAAYFDQKSMEDSSEVLGSLQRLALDQHASIMIVDHLRKRSGNLDTADVVEELIGSTGKTAAADAVLGLFRERRSARSRLAVTGRDLGERELLLELESETLTWQLVGEVDSVPRTDTEEEVLTALQALGGVGTTTTLADHLERDKGRVSKVLAALVEKELVIRGERQGRSVPYRLVESSESSKP